MKQKYAILRVKSEPQGIAEKINELDRFMGNLDDYKDFKRSQGGLSEYDTIEVMDTERSVKFVVDVFYSNPNPMIMGMGEEGEFLVRLVENGCIGLINYIPFCLDIGREGCGMNYYRSYGTPVRIKKR